MRTPVALTAMTIATIGLLAILSFGAISATDGEGFAWGEEERGLRIGIRVEREKVTHMNLFTFTTALKNCTGERIRIAAGGTWAGPMRPEYDICDDKKNHLVIAPPHVLHTGWALTHVPEPFFLELNPGEDKIVHRATFVPPVPSGEWKVYARLVPSADVHRKDYLRQLRAEGVWMDHTLVSGLVTLTVQGQEKDQPQTQWEPELPVDHRITTPEAGG